jgi:prepilin-type processing-associated H-X9-DG protein
LLNIENIDSLFSVFMLGDFAVINGSSFVKLLLTRLCVCAQLPYQLGGLETNVLFADGSNSFRLYNISTLAQRYELNPSDVLERIFVSRAFTAYQHASLIRAVRESNQTI